MKKMSWIHGALLAVAVGAVGLALTAGGGLRAAAGAHTPEEFGAVADDDQDDHAAIAKCLATHGEVRFGPGTYLVSRQIDASGVKGPKLTGAGRAATRIKLMDNCAPAAERSSYAVILAEGDNVEVRDLWVDCNFSGQATHRATLAAVHVFGGAFVIDGVKATGFQVGTSRDECFAIYGALRAGSGRDRVPGGVIRNCEVTDAAPNRQIPYDQRPIISGIFASGGGRVMVGATVESNYVHHLSATKDQRSEIHALGTGSVTGARVTGNLVRDVYGFGYYRDTWPADGLIIASNRFENVQVGIYFNTAGTQFGHRNVLVERNAIILAGDQVDFDASVPYSDQQSGFRIYGPGHMTNVVVRSNLFKGSKFGANKFPRAIWLWPKTAAYEAWTFENNVFDLPPNGLPRAGIFHYAATYDAAKVTWRSNRSRSGETAVLNVIDDKSGAIAFPVK